VHITLTLIPCAPCLRPCNRKVPLHPHLMRHNSSAINVFFSAIELILMMSPPRRWSMPKHARDTKTRSSNSVPHGVSIPSSWFWRPRPDPPVPAVVDQMGPPTCFFGGSTTRISAPGETRGIHQTPPQEQPPPFGTAARREKALAPAAFQFACCDIISHLYRRCQPPLPGAQRLAIALQCATAAGYQSPRRPAKVLRIALFRAILSL